MGGDMKKIKTVGEYFVEVWRAVGMEGLDDKVRAYIHEIAPRPHYLLSNQTRWRQYFVNWDF